MKPLAIGDLGGIIIPIPQNKNDAHLQEISSRWMGVRKEHVFDCARLARVRTGRTGIVAVACGPQRAAVIIESVKMGLINELIIDKSLPDAIEAVLKGLPK